MYVCLCNALTDRDVRTAAARAGAQRPAEVFAACRCRAQCGSCIRTVCGLLRSVLVEGSSEGIDDPTLARASSAA